jgi:hypothetical protein
MYHRMLVFVSCVFAVSLSPSIGKSSNSQLILPSFVSGQLILPKLAPVDLSRFRSELASVTKDRIPDDFIGGVLVDAVVLGGQQKDRYGQITWLVKPKHVYEGSIKIGQPFAVTSPTLKNGGTILKTGGYYRILAVEVGSFVSPPIRTKLFIWDGLVLELKR